LIANPVPAIPGLGGEVGQVLLSGHTTFAATATATATTTATTTATAAAYAGGDARQEAFGEINGTDGLVARQVGGAVCNGGRLNVADRGGKPHELFRVEQLLEHTVIVVALNNLKLCVGHRVAKRLEEVIHDPLVALGGHRRYCVFDHCGPELHGSRFTVLNSARSFGNTLFDDVMTTGGRRSEFPGHRITQEIILPDVTRGA